MPRSVPAMPIGQHSFREEALVWRWKTRYRGQSAVGHGRYRFQSSCRPRRPIRGRSETASARIALGRCGGSLPTPEWRGFSLAHARARDAVHVPLNAAVLQGELEAAGLPVVCLPSAARERETYLRRPDLGRRLDDDSRERLQQLRPNSGCDLVAMVSDGLSAPAAQRHAGPLTVRLTSR